MRDILGRLHGWVMGFYGVLPRRKVDLRGVYYDPRTNRFFSVRAATGEVLMCGGFTTYFSESVTVTSTQQLSLGYLADCKRVGSLDEMPEAHYDGIGWVVREDEQGTKALSTPMSSPS